MVTERDARDTPPWEDFEVEDERMADGRTIHYYAWPGRPGPEPEPGTGPIDGEGSADV